MLVNVTKKLPTKVQEKTCDSSKTTLCEKKLFPVWRRKSRKEQTLASYGLILDGTCFLPFKHFFFNEEMLSEPW